MKTDSLFLVLKKCSLQDNTISIFNMQFSHQNFIPILTDLAVRENKAAQRDIN